MKYLSVFILLTGFSVLACPSGDLPLPDQNSIPKSKQKAVAKLEVKLAKLQASLGRTLNKLDEQWAVAASDVTLGIYVDYWLRVNEIGVLATQAWNLNSGITMTYRKIIELSSQPAH